MKLLESLSDFKCTSSTKNARKSWDFTAELIFFVLLIYLIYLKYIMLKGFFYLHPSFDIHFLSFGLRLFLFLHFLSLVFLGSLSWLFFLFFRFRRRRWWIFTHNGFYFIVNFFDLIFDLLRSNHSILPLRLLLLLLIGV